MASPSTPLPPANPAPPEADPVAIRACLSQRLVVEFDADWDVALEQAKASKDLVGVHKLLQKWRHLAYAELRDPGSYFRLQAKAEQIMRTGENPKDHWGHDHLQAQFGGVIGSANSDHRWIAYSGPEARGGLLTIEIGGGGVSRLGQKTMVQPSRSVCSEV